MNAKTGPLAAATALAERDHADRNHAERHIPAQPLPPIARSRCELMQIESRLDRDLEAIDRALERHEKAMSFLQRVQNPVSRDLRRLRRSLRNACGLAARARERMVTRPGLRWVGIPNYKAGQKLIGDLTTLLESAMALAGAVDETRAGHRKTGRVISQLRGNTRLSHEQALVARSALRAARGESHAS